MATAFDLKWLKRKFLFWSLDASGAVEFKGRWFELYGFFQDSSEGGTSSRAVAAVEEATLLRISTRSSLWRVAEIEVERRSDWLVFSRNQKDLSIEGLKDFATDCASYLEYLLEEAKRYESVRQKE